MPRSLRSPLPFDRLQHHRARRRRRTARRCPGRSSPSAGSWSRRRSPGRTWTEPRATKPSATAEGVDEARADRLDVEGDADRRAELALHHGRGGRKGQVGRGGGHDDQVDVGRACGPAAARALGRGRRRPGREVASPSGAPRRRWRMPVRSTIQASLVSTTLARSSLVTHLAPADSPPTPVTDAAHDWAHAASPPPASACSAQRGRQLLQDCGRSRPR